MRVAFICDLPEEHFPFWEDGLRAAIRVLGEDWRIDIFNRPDTIDLAENRDDYDVAIYWMALTNPLADFRIFDKQVLCFAGGPTYHANIHNFDLVFAESKIDLLDMKRYGVNVVQAFGTNTDLFRPIPDQPKIYEYVYPAAFAKWKHHEKFAEYVAQVAKEKHAFYPIALAFGYMQPNGHEKECYEVCQESGIAVMPQVPYEAIPWIMNAARHVYVAADVMGGCQRTILEAKACNIPVIVDSDSPKLLELKDLTHEDVLKKWSHKNYAKKIKKGLESII